MNSPSQELLPCPFCGSGDVGGGSGIVSCYKCGIQTQKYETTAYAGTVWNTRAQQPTAPGGEDAVAQALEKAIQIVKENSWRLTGLTKESEDKNAEGIISEIRALIKEPQ